ncbi:MAG: transglutaminase family protein [Verrucomicrobiota bacterium]
MRFNVSSQVSYAINGPSTLILNVHALRSGAQMISEESFTVQPKVTCEEFVLDQGQNRFVRIETGSVKELNVAYRAVVDTQVKLIPMATLKTLTVGKLDRNVIPFIYPSRYCQSDKLGRLAFSKFGKITHPFEKVTAITNWIFENVQYLSGSTNWQTSAYDTVTERTGVCRDFAHLGIALCRALNIPARYFTGYAHQLQPPDFHACFEACIGGTWLLFDPTRLVPLNGLVRIATGRDAADAAVATIFGPAFSNSVQVSCEPAEAGFKPLTVDQLSKKGICLDAP